MGTENPLFLMSGDFKFSCLQSKNPVGIPKILVFFSSGDESSMYFSNGEGISGYFSHRRTGDEFWTIFPVGRGSRRVCDTGVSIGKKTKSTFAIHFQLNWLATLTPKKGLKVISPIFIVVNSTYFQSVVCVKNHAGHELACDFGRAKVASFSSQKFGKGA